MAEGACDGANGLGVPFKDKFDKTLKLYSLMTTKPEDCLLYTSPSPRD